MPKDKDPPEVRERSARVKTPLRELGVISLKDAQDFIKGVIQDTLHNGLEAELDDDEQPQRAQLGERRRTGAARKTSQGVRCHRQDKCSLWQKTNLPGSTLGQG